MALRAELDRRGPRRRAGDDRPPPRPPRLGGALAGDGLADPAPPRTDHAPAAQAAALARSSASRRPCPTSCWQADTTHWRLADGSDVEILNLIDDHSRLLPRRAMPSGRSRAATSCAPSSPPPRRHGAPAALLTDNGAVFTGGPRRGKIRLETELERLGIVAKHSTPNHPQTCGKVERFHQTLKRYLARQPPADVAGHPPGSSSTPFALLQRRAAPPGAARPAARSRPSSSRLKARPVPSIEASAHFRVRQDRVSKAGNVTVRYLSRLRHIGWARPMPASRSACSSPTTMSGSSARTARSSGNSSSTPSATTSRV